MAKGIYVGGVLGSNNLINNGDFSDGLNGWDIASSTTVTIENDATYGNYAAITCNVVSDVNILAISTKNQLSDGTSRVIYMCCNARGYSSNTGVIAMYSHQSTIDILNNDTWGFYSDRFTSNTFTNLKNTRASIIQGPTSATGNKVDVTNMQLYDLTAIFGAGNEPTKAWCDANLNTIKGVTNQPQALSSLPVGSLVKDPNSKFLGVPIIWRIAAKNHTGYPDGAITLITERCIAMRAFDAKEPNNSNSDRKSYGNNRYSLSNIRQWLNSDASAGQWYSAQHSADAAPSSTDYVACNVYSDDAGFLNGFSDGFKKALLETTLTVVLNTVTDGSGSETVTDKIFLASRTEVGLANENNIVEGALLPIFSDAASRIASVTAEGLEDSDYGSDPANDTTAWFWWLRTPYSSDTHSARGVHSSGALGTCVAYGGHYGVRPLCNLPSSILVSDTVDEDGCYTLFPKEGIARKVKKMYVGVDGVARKVKRGYIGVDGIARLFYYYTSKTLASLPVGSLVKDTSSLFLNKPVIWKIADKNHTGYPNNSVTLITDKIVALRCFDAKEPNNSNSSRQSGGNNRYSLSNIRQWLNSDASAGQWYSAQHSADAAPNSSNVWQSGGVAAINPYDTNAGFLNGFSADFKKALLETTLTVVLNKVTDGGESETVTDKIFLASRTEIGLANETDIVEILSIFRDNASRLASVTAEAIKDSNYGSDPAEGEAWGWWLRTPHVNYNVPRPGYVRYISSSGDLSNDSAYAGYEGVRPLCNLPSSILVSDTVDEDGCYNIIW